MARNHLTADQAIDLLRKYRRKPAALRGKVKEVSLGGYKMVNSSLFFSFLILLLLTMIFGLVARYVLVPYLMKTGNTSFPVIFQPFSAFFDGNIEQKPSALLSAAIGFEFALPFTFLYMIWPQFKLWGYGIVKRCRPPQKIIKRYPAGRQSLSLFSLSWLITVFVEWHSSTIAWYKLFPPASFYERINLPSLSLGAMLKFFILWMIFTLLMSLVIYRLLPKNTKADTNNGTEGDLEAHTAPFSLFLGETTGKLTERSHEAGMAENQHVVLSEKDAALNLMILGGIGEGKTTAVIHSLLIQLLDQDCGGLIFDVKGSFHRSVTTLAESVGKEVIMVGPTRQKINLISGLTPESASCMMASIFLMTNGSKDSSFWVNQAANLCRGALGVLHFLPEHYNLVGMQKFIFEEDFREDIDCLLSQLDMTEQQKKILSAYRSSLMMFEDTNDRMKSDIRAAASSALSHFTHPDISESFCNHTDEPLQLEQVLDGKIFLLDTPKATYGQASRVIHALIKMRWFQIMESRRVNEEWNQDRMVFFMCDEYQNMATVDPTGNSLNDMNFWDKSRDTKAIGIISAQGLSSFYSAIGHRDYTKTVLQNFRQKFCFKTEDDETLQYFQRLTGRVRIGQVTESKQQGSSHGAGRSHSSTSTTHSLSYTDREVVDAQLMRNLRANQVLALLNIGQESMDDILDLQPIYLPKEGGEAAKKEKE